MIQKPIPWYFKPIAPVLTRFLQWLESRGLLKFPRHLSTKLASTITAQFLADSNANDDVVNEYVHSMEDEVEKHPRDARKNRAVKGKTSRKKKTAKKSGKKKKAKTKPSKAKGKRGVKRASKKKSKPKKTSKKKIKRSKK